MNTQTPPTTPAALNRLILANLMRSQDRPQQPLPQSMLFQPGFLFKRQAE